MSNISLKLIKRHELSTTNWSGGTTTQLSIYPDNASFAERKFIWRISSAKVELEESTFTSLPGFNRIIMPLEGNITLFHENHHSRELKPFKQDFFKGSWTTRCIGKCRDFNLIFSETNCKSASVSHVSKNKTAYQTSISLMGTHITVGYYCVTGEAVITILNKHFKLETGDLFLIQNSDMLAETISVNSDSNFNTLEIQIVV